MTKKLFGNQNTKAYLFRVLGLFVMFLSLLFLMYPDDYLLRSELGGLGYLLARLSR